MKNIFKFLSNKKTKRKVRIEKKTMFPQSQINQPGGQREPRVTYVRDEGYNNACQGWLPTDPEGCWDIGCGYRQPYVRNDTGAPVVASCRLPTRNVNRITLPVSAGVPDGFRAATTPFY